MLAAGSAAKPGSRVLGQDQLLLVVFVDGQSD